MEILDSINHYKAVCRNTFYAQNRCLDLLKNTKTDWQTTNIARIFNLIKRK